MSNSPFCIQQRQKEKQQLKKLLLFGFASSTVIHGILAYALPRWSFESSQVVEEPMEVIIVDKIKPKPKVESKPVAQTPPPPVKPPEPVEQTPPPPVKPPEPVEQTPPPPVKPPEPVAQTPPPPVKPPEPVEQTPPKKVLTAPTPAPSQPKVPAPVENTAEPSSSPSSSSATSSENNDSDAPDSAVATNSAPPSPEASSDPVEGISCISNCEPEYPTALAGVEGSAGVKLTIDLNGNVMGAELASADSNSSVNRQALLAARQMQFSSPGEDAAAVQVKIDFTVEGSEYDRARREEQEKKEQAAREKEEQEQEAAARQQQQEAEQQAQQEQLEQERAQQEQLEQEAETPPPAPEADTPAPKPLPALSPEELNEEKLRKFKERMENYRED